MTIQNVGKNQWCIANTTVSIGAMQQAKSRENAVDQQLGLWGKFTDYIGFSNHAQVISTLYDLTRSKNLTELFKNVATLAELAPEERQDELMKKLQMELIPPSKKSKPEANSLEPKATIYFGSTLLMTVHMKEGWDRIEEYRDKENPDKFLRVRLAKTTKHEELNFYQENDSARIEFVTPYRGILMTPHKEETGYEDSERGFALDEVYSRGEYCQTTKPDWKAEFSHF